MDQFAAIRAFVIVVETGGFSGAARQLQMAVSSVTRQVNALENMLNTHRTYATVTCDRLPNLSQGHSKYRMFELLN